MSKSRNRPKSGTNDVTHTNYNCKAVEVTEIEVNSKKSGRKNHGWRRRIKNIAGQVLTNNSKNFHWLNRKLDQERTMNGSVKQFRKKSDPKKNEKTVNIKVKLPHVNKKPLARKRIFVQTPFSHSTLNLEQKNSRRQTTRFFAPLPVSAWPNHYSNLTSEIMKKREQILKT